MTEQGFMEDRIHSFDNGVKVYERHLIDIQKRRYSDHNVHEAEEEELFIGLINRIGQRAVFVNVGAAIGYYAILAKKIYPSLEVYAFEPLKLHRKYFKENIKLNGFSINDFSIYKEGLFTKKGYAEFMKNNYGSSIKSFYLGNGVLNRVKKFIGMMRNEVIKTITLDQIIKKIGQRIDLLQMDIQGREDIVLEHSMDTLKQNMIKYLLIGTHSHEIHNNCINLLELCGYSILFKNHDTKLQPDGILCCQKI